MNYRIKVLCPTCQQKKSAFWQRAVPHEARLLTHRVQPELADGEKPIRCKGSGDTVPLAEPGQYGPATKAGQLVAP